MTASPAAPEDLDRPGRIQVAMAYTAGRCAVTGRWFPPCTLLVRLPEGWAIADAATRRARGGRGWEAGA